MSGLIIIQDLSMTFAYRYCRHIEKILSRNIFKKLPRPCKVSERSKVLFLKKTITQHCKRKEFDFKNTMLSK